MVRVNQWVRFGPLRNDCGEYLNPRYGKVLALCQGGMRAIVRMHREHPAIFPNQWDGEQMIDCGALDVICRPAWDYESTSASTRFCPECGMLLIDSGPGYITGCDHHPAEIEFNDMTRREQSLAHAVRLEFNRKGLEGCGSEQ